MSIQGKNPNATDNFLDVRAIFTKKDRAKYISHLDLYRAMQRAFKRAKLPVWYTQGYNSRLYLNFALALSLGFESSCEIMDFRIVDDIPLEELEERLKKVMPEGLNIVKLYYPVMKTKDIAFSQYTIKFSTNEPMLLLSQFEEYLLQDTIIVYKKNKKKLLIETNIKPNIQVLSLSTNDENLIVSVMLPAGNGLNLNPTLITDSFKQYTNITIDRVSYVREKIFSQNGEVFL